MTMPAMTPERVLGEVAGSALLLVLPLVDSEALGIVDVLGLVVGVDAEVRTDSGRLTATSLLVPMTVNWGPLTALITKFPGRGKLS